MMTQIETSLIWRALLSLTAEGWVVIDFGCELQFASFVRLQDNQSTNLLKLEALFPTFPWIMAAKISIDNYTLLRQQILLTGIVVINYYAAGRKEFSLSDEQEPTDGQLVDVALHLLLLQDLRFIMDIRCQMSLLWGSCQNGSRKAVVLFSLALMLPEGRAKVCVWKICKWKVEICMLINRQTTSFEESIKVFKLLNGVLRSMSATVF